MEDKSYLKREIKCFLKNVFLKLYPILKELCHKLIGIVLLYSPRRHADVFLHDNIGDRG